MSLFSRYPSRRGAPAFGAGIYRSSAFSTSPSPTYRGVVRVPRLGLVPWVYSNHFLECEYTAFDLLEGPDLTREEAEEAVYGLSRLRETQTWGDRARLARLVKFSTHTPTWDFSPGDEPLDMGVGQDLTGWLADIDGEAEGDGARFTEALARMGHLIVRCREDVFRANSFFYLFDLDFHHPLTDTALGQTSPAALEILLASPAGERGKVMSGLALLLTVFSPDEVSAALTAFFLAGPKPSLFSLYHAMRLARAHGAMPTEWALALS